jgi:hypothetical protein
MLGQLPAMQVDAGHGPHDIHRDDLASDYVLPRRLNIFWTPIPTKAAP